LALSGYSNDGLFFQDTLLEGVLATLAELAQRTREPRPEEGESSCRPQALRQLWELEVIGQDAYRSSDPHCRHHPAVLDKPSNAIFMGG
jgi:hypothetical protein